MTLNVAAPISPRHSRGVGATARRVLAITIATALALGALVATPGAASAVEPPTDGVISGNVAKPRLSTEIVTVSAYRQASDAGGWQLVSEARMARFEDTYSLNVPAGSYRIAFSTESRAFPTQVFPGVSTDDPAASLAGARLVSVQPGETVTHIDARMATVPNSLAGVVTAAQGDLPEEFQVRLEVYNTNIAQWETESRGHYSGSNRAYQFTRLRPGSYRVSAEAEYTHSSVVQSFLVTGDSTIILDLELVLTTSRIRGEVTSELPSSRLVAEAWQKWQDARYPDWELLSTVPVAADGSYELAVPDGTYAVRFLDQNLRNTTQYFDGLDSDAWLDGRAGIAGIREVIVEGQPVSGINARLHAEPHSIFGAVTASFGESPATYDIVVDIRDGNDSWSTVSRTHHVPSETSDTYFLDGLEPGEYRITIDAGKYFSPVAHEVTITAGHPAQVDFVVPRVATSTITGSVFVSDGHSSNIDVQAWTDTGSGWELVDDDSVSGSTFELTVPFGDYRLRAVDTQHYYQPQVYPGINTRASVGSVSGASTVTVDGRGLQPIVWTMDAMVSASGVVSDFDGPLAGVEVTLRLWDAELGAFIWYQRADSNSRGEFTFSDLVPGDKYTLFFDRASVESVGQSVWLNGSSNHPVDASASGVRTVMATGDRVDFTLPTRPLVSGRVLATDAASPFAHGDVDLYSWDPIVEEWARADTATTDASGHYRFAPLPGETYSVRVATHGFEATLGGGSGLPAAPRTSNSFAFGSTDFVVPTLALQARPTDLGSVAGLDLDYCQANTIAASDDGSSGEIELPFHVDFFGRGYSSLFVNTNGNVTFGEPLAGFSESTLTSATGTPIIAPFLSDIDTRHADSRLVSYGASADGTTFCVNWADVGYYDRGADRRNTFQLVLTSRSNTVDRVAGDFDITFNYDTLQWAVGDSEDLGSPHRGLPAAAGFSAGTGVVGSSVRLADGGSGYELADDGDRALTRNSRNSEQTGRYIFEITNGVPPAVPTGVPVVTGLAVVGATLSVHAPGVPRSATTTGQWNRITAGGTESPITGATEFSYRPVTADAGNALSFTLTASLPGYSTTTVTSPPTASVRKVLTRAPTPTITGTAKVGKTLKAHAGTWSPAKVTIAYRWYSDGKAIANARSSTYKIPSRYKKSKIMVQITGTKSAYVTVVKSSKPTAKVR